MNRLFVVFAIALLMSACTDYPTYQAPDTGTTWLNISDVPEPWICVEGTKRVLVPNDEGEVLIPIGARITVGGTYTVKEFRSSSNCEAALSFYPVANNKYLAHWEFVDKVCRVEIYRYSDSNRVGLDREKSVGEGVCR